MVVGSAIAWLAVVVSNSGVGLAQERQPAATTAGDAVVARGSGLFRERCAECHGSDAKGVPGHDLTRLWASGATDQRVFQTIRNGVPNTIMPSSAAPDEEILALVIYLRSLNSGATTESAAGNASNGDRLFWATCGSCHAINGRGGRLGPDFSRIAQTREQLTQAIRTPSATFAAGFEPVTLMTRNGQRIRGVKKGEDAFSIQIMDSSQRLQGYLKSSLREVIDETSSLMPEFGPARISDGDLDDLARFLSTFRPPPSSSRRP